VTGRWAEKDPAGYVDGLNRYTFVQGRPTSLHDSRGLQTEDVAELPWYTPGWNQRLLFRVLRNWRGYNDQASHQVLGSLIEYIMSGGAQEHCDELLAELDVLADRMKNLDAALRGLTGDMGPGGPGYTGNPLDDPLLIEIILSWNVSVGEEAMKVLLGNAYARAAAMVAGGAIEGPDGYSDVCIAIEAAGIGGPLGILVGVVGPILRDALIRTEQARGRRQADWSNAQEPYQEHSKSTSQVI